MPDANPPISLSEVRPGIADLFMGFLEVGLLGFGGVLPLARRMIVEQRGWMDGPAFTDLLALCQFLPGGNVINLSVAVGLRFRGIAGAVAALAGLLAAPMAVSIALVSVYERYQAVPMVRTLFLGLGAAAAGLILSLALKLARPVLATPLLAGVAVLCFVSVALLRLPLLPTMLVLSPLGMFVAWRSAR